ncbi:MAG: SMI1/KNR4 family protein [Chloroflexota bacterium]|nr:SMI1/KNR4 family protein [Chloroflexota bacterium]
MVSFDWEHWLMHWNTLLFEHFQPDAYGPDYLTKADLSPEVLATGWFGYPPATPAQLATTEARLGIALPPSYRAFLQTSNGWRQPGWFVSRLWAVDNVEWFHVRHQHDWIEPWRIGEEEYAVDGEAQTLRTALEISDVGDAAVYLLNPHVITADNEWEAWFFASWVPGSIRYPSFWDLMQAEYTSFWRLKNESIKDS